MAENEKQFESNIEAFLISSAGGYEKATDAGYTSSSGMALDINTLVGFVKATQPIMWQRFEKQCNSDPYKKFYKCFEDAVQMDGLLSVMRHGFKHRGMDFKVCYFKPESTLNDVAVKRYMAAHNESSDGITLIRDGNKMTYEQALSEMEAESDE